MNNPLLLFNEPSTHLQLVQYFLAYQTSITCMCVLVFIGFITIDN